MAANGWRGVTRARRRRAPPSPIRPQPGHRTWWAGGGGLAGAEPLHVADFTYVPMTAAGSATPRS